MSTNDKTKWMVTEFGIEAQGPVAYLIPKEDLAKLRDAEKGIGDWPLQMADKTWVNMDELWKVYIEGLQHHRPSRAIADQSGGHVAGRLKDTWDPLAPPFGRRLRRVSDSILA